MPYSPNEVKEEEAHFANVIAAFRQYEPYCVCERSFPWLIANDLSCLGDFRSQRTIGAGKTSILYPSRTANFSRVWATKRKLEKPMKPLRKMRNFWKVSSRTRKSLGTTWKQTMIMTWEVKPLLVRLVWENIHKMVHNLFDSNADSVIEALQGMCMSMVFRIHHIRTHTRTRIRTCINMNILHQMIWQAGKSHTESQSLTWTNWEALLNNSCAIGAKRLVKIFSLQSISWLSVLKGKLERDASYGPMVAALLDHFSDIPREERWEHGLCSSPRVNADADALHRSNFRVLVPGAGLGRMAWDIANLGEYAQSMKVNIAQRELEPFRFQLSRKWILALHAAVFVLYLKPVCT